MDYDFECCKCGAIFCSSEDDEGTIPWEIATCPECGGIAQPYEDD